MKWLRVVILVCIVAVLQAGLINLIAVTSLDIKPDLLLILMVFFAIFAAPREAIITSFAIGFAADLIAIGMPMGPRTISFGLVGAAVAYIHGVLVIRKISHQAVAVFICCFIAAVLSHFLTLLTGRPVMPFEYRVIFGTALYSSIISPFLFLPSSWLMRIKTNRFGRY